jgi:hypothetical protein
MVRRGAIWDLLYEHCLYFTSRPLRFALEQAGFVNIQIQERFAGQFLAAQADAGPAANEPLADPEPSEEWERDLAGFADVHRKTISDWDGRLRQWAVHDVRVAIWGAGTKGIMFANSVPSAARVAALVDVNPRKWNRYAPGVGLPILAPDHPALAEVQVVLVMNPIYTSEIQQQMRRLNWEPEVIPVSCGRVP